MRGRRKKIAPQERKRFGEYLKQARLNLGLSGREASLCMGFAQGTLSRWEQGLAFPSEPNLNKIAEFYEIEIPKKYAYGF